jgi:hypothetical protein
MAAMESDADTQYGDQFSESASFEASELMTIAEIRLH